jgi:hypothetical protein
MNVDFRSRMQDRIAKRRERGDPAEQIAQYVEQLGGSYPSHAQSFVNCLSFEEVEALTLLRAKRKNDQHDRAIRKAESAGRPSGIRLAEIKKRNGRIIRGIDIKGTRDRYDYRYDGAILRVGKRTIWIPQEQIVVAKYWTEAPGGAA